MSAMSDRWSGAQKDLYGRVYRFMSFNQAAHSHPNMTPVASEHWETICHNAAWLAAEFLVDCDLTIEDVESGEVVATTKQITLQ